MARLVSVTIAGVAARIVREGSPEESVARAVAGAAVRRRGRGYQYIVTATPETLRALADYLESVADVVGDMTAGERDGGTEHIAARRAVAAIDAALAEAETTTAGATPAETETEQ